MAQQKLSSSDIVSVANTAITGNMTSSQISSVANTAITGLINSNQLATTAQPVGFKNRIINGDFRISQYNGTSSVTLTNSSSYTIDRFFTNRIGGAATFTVQQSSTAPAGFINSYQVTVGTGAVPTGSNEGCFAQCIEGLNVADFGFGSANAKTFTLSFWVQSSVTGTYGVTFFNSAFNRSYVTSYVINAANTWEYKTITVAGDTSGTWLTTNGRGLCVCWDLGTGSTYSAAASSSWQAGGYEGLTGGTKLASTAGATWYITGIQIEVGSQATSFDFRDYGRELILCQRYFQISQTTQGATSSVNDTQFLCAVQLWTPMRTSPTSSLNGSPVIHKPGIAFISISSVDSGPSATGGSYTTFTIPSGYGTQFSGQAISALKLSAEL